MRWGYIIPRLVLVLVIYLFFYFAFDPILKIVLIKSLQNVFNAKIDIEKIKTKFINPSFEIYNLKVGNKDEEFKNLFEFKELRFKLNGKQLLEKKFIIEEASLKGLEFNTPRKTSCKIYIPKTEMPEFVKKYIDESKDLALDRFNDIKTDFVKDIKIETDNLESVKLINELKNKYENEYKDIIEKADFKKYEERIKIIETKYEEVKKEKDIFKQIKKADEIKKEIDKLSKDFKNDKENISKLITDTKDIYKKIEEAKKNDIEKVMSVYKLPTLDKDKITQSLLGKEIIEKVNKYYTISKQAVKYIPENPKKKVFSENKKRGRIVHFIKYENYPKFLIKKIHIDGVLTPENPIQYSGEVLNITNQPILYQKPLTINISGSKDISKISINSYIYLYREPSESQTVLKYTGAKIGNLFFGNEKSIKLEIEKSIIDNFLEIKTISDNIDAKFLSNFKDALINADASIIKYEQIRKSIEESFKSLKEFNLSVNINGKFSSPNVKINTDLTNIILNALKSSFNKQIDDAKKQIQNKIDNIVKEQKDKLDNVINEKKKDLDEKLKENQKKIDEFKKGFEDKLENSFKKNIKVPKIKI